MSTQRKHSNKLFKKEDDYEKDIDDNGSPADDDSSDGTKQ